MTLKFCYINGNPLDDKFLFETYFQISYSHEEIDRIWQVLHCSVPLISLFRKHCCELGTGFRKGAKRDC